MPEEQFTIADRPHESRYVLLDRAANNAVIGEESYVDVLTGETTERVLFHTSVSEDYSGQGLASLLVQHVVNDVVARGYRIIPVCPYVKKWLVKNPSVADHVTEPRADHLRAIAAQRSAK